MLETPLNTKTKNKEEEEEKQEEEEQLCLKGSFLWLTSQYMQVRHAELLIMATEKAVRASSMIGLDV